MGQAAAKFRRSTSIVFWFRDGRLQCRNYLTHIEVKTSPLTVGILAVLDKWRTLGQIARLLTGWSESSIRRTMRRLSASTLIVERGSHQDQQERLIAPWQAWGEEAAFFHFGTKPAHRAPPVADERQFSRVLLKRSPMPPSFKRYRGTLRVALPEVRARFESEFPQVLLSRRTVRQFGEGRVSLDRLATLLHLTFGVTGTIEWPGLGRLPVRTSPSGGARQSLEAYVFALRVDGLSRGAYHYRADRHQLELVRRGCRADRLTRFCAHQEWVEGCAALCVLTAVFPRMMWRYQSSRAYRVVLLEAGHFCQTFCLVATWLGLASFSTAALLDENLEAHLRINGADESVLYAAGIGSRT